VLTTELKTVSSRISKFIKERDAKNQSVKLAELMAWILSHQLKDIKLSKETAFMFQNNLTES
jgi:hypothetical protein